MRLEIEVVDSLEQVCEHLHGCYYNLVMVDCRNLLHDRADPVAQERALSEFFEVLRRDRDRERRYPRRRVLVLVGDQDEERIDRLMFEMGQRHVGGCVRDLSLSPRRVGSKRAAARARFFDQIWSFCRNVLVETRRGKKAINCTAGGISGIYYELGVLKCLHDAFDIDIRDFDMFFGISGGSVVASCLANGFHLDDLIAKVGDMDSDWRYKLRIGWRQLNVAEVPRRLLLAQRELIAYILRMLRRKDDFSVASILGTYAVLLGPIFDNSDFEGVLRDLFGRPGHTNDFRELKRELYVGVSDQDRRDHVLLGGRGFEDVPISVAVQASSAMHPFFPSVEIGGRYFTDGIVTRTSNLRAAIDFGADLVFVIDPFVPLIADEAGYNARHGNMWIVEQDYKTLAYTRFSQARNEIVRQNPGVNIYTFVPSNRMRRLMSGQNPFVARNFHPIVCAAYRSTYRRLKQLEYKVAGELASHDIRLDLDPVEDKVKRLRQARTADVSLILDDAAQSSSRVA